MAMEFPKDFNPYVRAPVDPGRGEVLPEFAQSWEPFRILWQVVLEFVQMECFNISDPGALSLESVKPQAVENPLVKSWCPYYSQEYEFCWREFSMRQPAKSSEEGKEEEEGQGQGDEFHCVKGLRDILSRHFRRFSMRVTMDWREWRIFLSVPCPGHPLHHSFEDKRRADDPLRYSDAFIEQSIEQNNEQVERAWNYYYNVGHDMHLFTIK